MTVSRRAILRGAPVAAATGLGACRGARSLLPAPTTAAGVPYSDDDLFADEGRRLLSGPNLARVAFPIGGIGTGTVSISGTGDLQDFELWNRPARGRTLPFTFVSIRAQSDGEDPVLRVARAEPVGPRTVAEGLEQTRGAGFPHLAQARFEGAYPFCRVHFEDEHFPVRVRLEAWNPMVPLSVDDSSLPVAILSYEVFNPSHKSANVTLAFSAVNPVGHDWRSPAHAVHESFSTNLIERVEQPLPDGGQLFGLACSSERVRADYNEGTFAIAALCSSADTATYAPESWEDGINGVYHYGQHLLRTGDLLPGAAEMPTPDGHTCWGALSSRFVLQPRQRQTVTFIVAWHVPNRQNNWHDFPEIEGAVLRNDYGRRFSDAWSVAEHTARNLTRLEAATRQFSDALFSSTVPGIVVDAVSTQMSALRTTSCMLLDDEVNGQTLYGFEGSLADAPVGPLNCAHVWNYAQTVAYLFPSLERSMRRVDYMWNMFDDGSMAPRTIVPLGRRIWDGHASADGQLGTIMRLCREWKLTSDAAFLRELWPAARRALEYAWSMWDPDRDGVIEGEQHTTFDVELYGPNPLVGLLYLGALQAMIEMGEALEEKEAVTQYRALAVRGRARLEGFWNGDYFEQQVAAARDIVAPPTEGANRNDPPLRGVVKNDVRFQIGRGCLSDQLMGAWLARQLGLQDLIDVRKTQQTLSAIFAHNFRPHMRDMISTDRAFVRSGEAAMVNCSWPRGERPRWPLRHADEVWTGTEYAVAAHLISEGLVREGLSIVKAVHDRYDGARRNPWDHQENGHHGVRAMSSFSLLLAASGFSCSAPDHQIGFLPRFRAHDFQCLFSSGTAWGRYTQKQSDTALSAGLTVQGGQLDVAILDLPPWLPAREILDAKLTVRTPGGNVAHVSARVEWSGRRTRLRAATTCQIQAGGSLTVTLASG